MRPWHGACDLGAKLIYVLILSSSTLKLHSLNLDNIHRAAGGLTPVPTS